MPTKTAENSNTVVSRNTMKTLTPCFIQDILEESTSRGVTMTQKRIREVLMSEHGISIARQALGRHVNTLLREEAFNIFADKDGGYYYDSKSKGIDDPEFFDIEEESADGTKTNDRQSLMCCFLRDILMAKQGFPLNQERLIVELNRYPYEINPDRKSVSRTLNTLMEAYPEIQRNNNGYYYNSLNKAA